LRGAPRNWDQEGVSQFLGGADFTDIVFTTKKKGKKRYHKGPQTHLQLLFERQDFERAVERTQRNVVSHGTTRLHGERRVSLDPTLKRRVEMVDPTTPAEQPEVQPAKMDLQSQQSQAAEAKGEDDADMGAGSVAKRLAAVGASPDHQN